MFTEEKPNGHVSEELLQWIEKYNNCVAKINPEINCSTCKYEEQQDKEHSKPCNECYCEMLGLPVNCTNWEKK
jgi:flagellar capping protein FliD